MTEEAKADCPKCGGTHTRLRTDPGCGGPPVPSRGAWENAVRQIGACGPDDRARLSPGEPSGEAISDATIGYVLRYGGMCRDCADADGTCPGSGLPCDPTSASKVIHRVLEAVSYGRRHGFLAPPSPGGGDGLVERLRKVESGVECGPGQPNHGGVTNWYRNPDGPEAAAEIERLKSLLAQYRDVADLEARHGDEAAAEIEALRARVGVLETALEPFALLAADEHSTGANMNDPLSKWFGVAHLQAARQALQQKEAG